MKSTVAAAVAIVFAIAATTASAGVAISQHLVLSDQSGEKNSDQTVMVQGHKQKVITGDKQTITDLDTGKMYVFNTKTKQFMELPFPPPGMFARIVAREGITVEPKKTGGTNKVAGYTCQDYAGIAVVARSNVSVTQCVAGDAPGAKEFVEFQKARAKKLKGTFLEPKGEVPDGIPVSSTTTTMLIPFPVPRGFPPAQAAKLKEDAAKAKPTISNTTVSKIEVKDLPADTFVVPAGYDKREIQMPKLVKAPGMPPVNLETAPAAPGSSTKLVAPAAPAAPGKPAPH